MATTEKTKLFQVWIEPDLNERIHAVARSEGGTASSIARRALIREIELQEAAGLLAGQMIGRHLEESGTR